MISQVVHKKHLTLFGKGYFCARKKNVLKRMEKNNFAGNQIKPITRHLIAESFLTKSIPIGLKAYLLYGWKFISIYTGVTLFLVSGLMIYES